MVDAVPVPPPNTTATLRTPSDGYSLTAHEERRRLVESVKTGRKATGYYQAATLVTYFGTASALTSSASLGGLATVLGTLLVACIYRAWSNGSAMLDHNDALEIVDTPLYQFWRESLHRRDRHATEEVEGFTRYKQEIESPFKFFKGFINELSKVHVIFREAERNAMPELEGKHDELKAEYSARHQVMVFFKIYQASLREILLNVYVMSPHERKDFLGAISLHDFHEKVWGFKLGTVRCAEIEELLAPRNRSVAEPKAR